MKAWEFLILNALIKSDGWNRFSFFPKSMCPTMHFRQWQKHKWSSQQKGAARKRDKHPPKNKSEKKGEKKRRYMKSSCRWTTIHFHFEVLRTVVKCDCMWQLPSLPVYNDGYTLPPWLCCSTLRYAHTKTWIQRHTEVGLCRHVYTDTDTETTHLTQILHSHKLAHRDKVISDPLSNWMFLKTFLLLHSV